MVIISLISRSQSNFLIFKPSLIWMVRIFALQIAKTVSRVLFFTIILMSINRAYLFDCLSHCLILVLVPFFSFPSRQKNEITNANSVFLRVSLRLDKNQWIMLKKQLPLQCINNSSWFIDSEKALLFILTDALALWRKTAANIRKQMNFRIMFWFLLVHRNPSA